jgi:hypothetical protein
VGVDESWRDHVPGGVDGLFTADLFPGNGRDPAILYADIRNGIVQRFGVHDPAISNDDIEMAAHIKISY